jgi:hypothetical protein
MAYRGISVFPQQELESVRRQRENAVAAQEYGVKGMKWGAGQHSKTGRGPGYVRSGRIDPLTGRPEWVPKRPPKSKRPKAGKV